MVSKCIIIPIYKLEISDDEIISLKQCFKNLSNHQIIFVGPLDLDISFYKKILERENLVVEYFDQSFFKNIKGYNQLMLSKEFYERFVIYDYMLIHQLDCYVFKDELDFWCNQGYDYIGAPWLDYSYYRKSKIAKSKFLVKRFFSSLFLDKYRSKDILTYEVGNGGFSLRNVRVFLDNLNKIDQKIINKFKDSNDPNSLFNEDVFWSFEAKGIKKPTYKIASGFSLDYGIDIGIRLNKNQLPFGAHAWNKNKETWKKYIDL